MIQQTKSINRKYLRALNRIEKKRVEAKANGKCICLMCEKPHDCPEDCKWHPWNGDECLCDGCYFTMPELLREKLNKLDEQMYFIGNGLLAYKVHGPDNLPPLEMLK